MTKAERVAARILQCKDGHRGEPTPTMYCCERSCMTSICQACAVAGVLRFKHFKFTGPRRVPKDYYQSFHCGVCGGPMRPGVTPVHPYYPIEDEMEKR